jgi:leucine dehydrogenase
MQITTITSPAHEHVIRVADAGAGLIGFIAIHSTQLGPAAGGLRMRQYESEDAALNDVLRLSHGMTFKNAAAGLPLGGGKAVIIGDPARKTPAMLTGFARAIDLLKGRYWTAEDMGMTPEDMAVLANVTPYVAGLPDGEFASGDPSPITAQGIFNAIRCTAKHRFGTADLTGRRVAVQGLGHVGWHLAGLLRGAGATLIVADIDGDRAAEAGQRFGAEIVPVEDILSAPADILAPCAIGGVLNAETIPALNVRAVAGGANNQLATPADGDRLHARGILYAPDYVANAGGIINVATEILRISDRPAFVARKLAQAEATLDAILSGAAARGVAPHRVADETVLEQMRARAA